MSNFFRIERTEKDPNRIRNIIRIYPKHKENLPVVKDWNRRYCSFFEESEPFLDDIYNFEVRPDDVWLVTLPKSGNTWMTELIWLLVNNFDYYTAYNVDLEDRGQLLEYCTFLPSKKPNSLEMAASLPSPRAIRSHLPMHLLPKQLWTVKPKIIYVARDPKDFIVSITYYAYGLGHQRNLQSFINLLCKDELNFSPHMQHILEFWSIRNESNVLFTSYEKMKNNLRSVVEQVCELLQKKISEEEMEKLLKHLSLDEMKKNPMCNHNKESKELQIEFGGKQIPFTFIRKGQVGTYKDELTEEMIETINKWTEENLKPHGLTLDEILLK